jgi:amino acid transporter
VLDGLHCLGSCHKKTGGMSACQIAGFFKSLNVLGGRGLVLQSLGSLVAFQAMVSIATIGLYISYALPIFFRITIARKTFVPGPFNLGRYSLFIGWVAVAWVVVITVLFCLPVAYPVNKSSLNYTPVAVGGVFVLVLLYWALSARRWFKGPLVNLDESARDQKLAQL